MYERILVPVDGSPTSNLGLKEAIKLAQAQGSRLCLFHVVNEMVLIGDMQGAAYVGDLIGALEQAGKAILATAEQQCRKQNVPFESSSVATVGGSVAELIVKQAKKWKADLIVLGTHGRRGITHMVMGSDAEGVVREAPVPVLLVRSPKKKK
jgi:nucleotide-binding universal stress UspA family protein